MRSPLLPDRLEASPHRGRRWVPDPALLPLSPAGAIGIGLTFAIAIMAGLDLLKAYTDPSWSFFLGRDRTTYLDATRDWLNGSGFYLQRQLHGPYVIADGDRLYPPPLLILLVPFTVLPAILWWAIPLGIMCWVVWHHRPPPLAWPLIGLCIWWPTTILKIQTGNPVMWAAAALALGTIYPWAAPFAAAKLTVAPLALFGIRDRRWWIGAAVLAAVSLLFLPMWPDYIRAIVDSRNPYGFLYSIRELPLMLIPLIAWAGARFDLPRLLGYLRPRPSPRSPTD